MKSSPYGENGKILTILTDRGKEQAVAPGAGSNKSKLLAGISVLCYSSFVLQRSRGKLPYIKSCDVIESFYNLRLSVEKLALAAYFAELAGIASESEEAHEVLQFTLNSLYLLARNEEFLSMKPIFEMRLMMIVGLAPLTERCPVCGSGQHSERFSVSEGGILCVNCAGGEPMLSGTLAALRYTLSREMPKIYSFNASAEVRSELAYLCESYLLYHIQLRPKSLLYLKELIKGEPPPPSE